MGRFHANRFGGTKDLSVERQRSKRDVSLSRARLAREQHRRHLTLRRGLLDREQRPPEVRDAIEDIVRAMNDEYKLGRSILRQLETLQKWIAQNLEDASEQEIVQVKAMAHRSINDAIDAGLIDQCTVQAIVSQAPQPVPPSTPPSPFPIGPYLVWTLVIYILVQRMLNHGAGPRGELP